MKATNNKNQKQEKEIYQYHLIGNDGKVYASFKDLNTGKFFATGIFHLVNASGEILA